MAGIPDVVLASTLDVGMMGKVRPVYSCLGICGESVRYEVS